MGPGYRSMQRSLLNATEGCVPKDTHGRNVFYCTRFDWDQYEFDASRGYPGEGPSATSMTADCLGDALHNLRVSLDADSDRTWTPQGDVFHDAEDGDIWDVAQQCPVCAHVQLYPEADLDIVCSACQSCPTPGAVGVLILLKEKFQSSALQS